MIIEKERFSDSKKNKPHYYIGFNTKNGEHVGGYNVSGYYLYSFYITREFRGRGFSKLIINHAVSKKKNLYLDVNPDNIPAIKCYERAGFKFEKELTYYNPLWDYPDETKYRVLRYKHQK